MPRRLAVRDLLRRWWHSPDRPWARATGAVLLAVLLGSGRWPTTVLHLLNSVYFVVLPLVLFHLQSNDYDPGSDGSSARLGARRPGTAAYAVAALGCAVAALLKGRLRQRRPADR